MNRRQLLFSSAALATLPRLGFAKPLAPAVTSALVGAAWRGPHPGDPYQAGVLAADWAAEKLAIRYSLQLPTRPHGLTAERDGGLLVIGVRPGTWMLRCDGEGRIVQQMRMEGEGSTRLNGHAAASPDGELLYTTETDLQNGRGCIGVRERRSLKKIAQWDSHGIDPHQLVIDYQGNLIVANGGVPRTPQDLKYDLHRMDSSLVRLDAGNGSLLRQWRLEDRRLSMRHLAWSHTPVDAKAYLGIALQAEHGDAGERSRAPLLALLHEEQLIVPTHANDGIGYAGDIAAVVNGGFAVSSNQAGLAQLWHPGKPEELASIVKLKESYALASWPGTGDAGGLLVATAYGLVRWLPTEKAAFLPWPQPMAVDNHWVLMA